MIIRPRDPAYPRRLLELLEPPIITVSGPEVARPLDAPFVVAIVGSREADELACAWTYELAYHLTRAGAVIVSGGAVGIDHAAHRGALEAGATWCVACTGRRARPFPYGHRYLFEEIEAATSDETRPVSRMVWPFSASKTKTKLTPRQRNETLVALAHAVVVVQASRISGSQNAATHADRLRRPLYVVPGPPSSFAFQGSAKLILEGAVPVFTMEQLFRELNLERPIIRGDLPQQPPIREIKRRGQSLRSGTELSVDLASLPPDERAVYPHVYGAPVHQDEIVANCGLGASATLSALLTLSLKDVVVEGPDGYFRLKTEA